MNPYLSSVLRGNDPNVSKEDLDESLLVSPGLADFVTITSNAKSSQKDSRGKEIKDAGRVSLNLMQVEFQNTPVNMMDISACHSLGLGSIEEGDDEDDKTIDSAETTNQNDSLMLDPIQEEHNTSRDVLLSKNQNEQIKISTSQSTQNHPNDTEWEKEDNHVMSYNNMENVANNDMIMDKSITNFGSQQNSIIISSLEEDKLAFIEESKTNSKKTSIESINKKNDFINFIKTTNEKEEQTKDESKYESPEKSLTSITAESNHSFVESQNSREETEASLQPQNIEVSKDNSIVSIIESHKASLLASTDKMKKNDTILPSKRESIEEGADIGKLNYAFPADENDSPNGQNDESDSSKSISFDKPKEPNEIFISDSRLELSNRLVDHATDDRTEQVTNTKDLDYTTSATRSFDANDDVPLPQEEHINIDTSINHSQSFTHTFPPPTLHCTSKLNRSGSNSTSDIPNNSVNSLITREEILPTIESGLRKQIDIDDALKSPRNSSTLSCQSASNYVENNKNKLQTPSISSIIAIKHETNNVESVQHGTISKDMTVSVSEPIIKGIHIVDEDCVNFGHTEQQKSRSEPSNSSFLNAETSPRSMDKLTKNGLSPPSGNCKQNHDKGENLTIMSRSYFEKDNKSQYEESTPVHLPADSMTKDQSYHKENTITTPSREEKDTKSQALGLTPALRLLRAKMSKDDASESSPDRFLMQDDGCNASLFLQSPIPHQSQHNILTIKTPDQDFLRTPKDKDAVFNKRQSRADEFVHSHSHDNYENRYGSTGDESVQHSTQLLYEEKHIVAQTVQLSDRSSFQNKNESIDVSIRRKSSLIGVSKDSVDGHEKFSEISNSTRLSSSQNNGDASSSCYVDLKSAKKKLGDRSSAFVERLRKESQKRKLELARKQTKIKEGEKHLQKNNKISLMENQKNEINCTTSTSSTLSPQRNKGKIRTQRSKTLGGQNPYKPFKARLLPSSVGELGNGGQHGVPKVSKRPVTVPKSPKLGIRQDMNDKTKGKKEIILKSSIKKQEAIRKKTTINQNDVKNINPKSLHRKKTSSTFVPKNDIIRKVSLKNNCIGSTCNSITNRSPPNVNTTTTHHQLSEESPRRQKIWKEKMEKLESSIQKATDLHARNLTPQPAKDVNKSQGSVDLLGMEIFSQRFPSPGFGVSFDEENIEPGSSNHPTTKKYQKASPRLFASRIDENLSTDTHFKLHSSERATKRAEFDVLRQANENNNIQKRLQERKKIIKKEYQELNKLRGAL